MARSVRRRGLLSAGILALCVASSMGQVRRSASVVAAPRAQRDSPLVPRQVRPSTTPRLPGPPAELYFRPADPGLPTAPLAGADTRPEARLRTHAGEIDLDRAAAAGSSSTRLHLVRAIDSSLAPGDLRGAGARVLLPYGPSAWLVEVDPGPGADELRRVPGVSAVAPFGPAVILDPGIGKAARFSLAEASRPELSLIAALIPGSDARRVAGDLAGLGAEIDSVEAPPGGVATVRFRLDPGRLAGVAGRVPGLLRVEEERIYEAADEETASTLQRGEFRNGEVLLWEAGVTGGGGGLVPPQLVAVTDTGLSYDALHFADTATEAGVPGPGHAKLQAYVAVGGGDLSTCDAAASGGSTHGNIVAGIIAGNVSRFGVDLRANAGWTSGFTSHVADGVAPGARIVFQDAQDLIACTGAFATIAPGSVFDRLAEARAQGARIHNLSFSALGSEALYTIDALNVDRFLRDNADYLVVTAAGNEAIDHDGDGNFDYGSVTSPGTAKNALAVGASNAANEPINPFDPDQALSPGVPNEGVNLLAVFAEGSTGRGPATFPGRVKPDVMGPGQDVFPNLRVDGLAACRSSDNDNLSSTGGVECLLDADNDGTSFAAAGVSGAAALVRDYYAQGFGDDGASGGPGVGTELSGAALKALLIASAEFMRVSPAFDYDLAQPRFDVPDLAGRFNFEQGYGRVHLGRLLPLATDASSPPGLILEDPGSAAGLRQGESVTRQVTVLDPARELRVVLAWMDPPDYSGAGVLVNDLDLEVTDHGPDGSPGNGDDIRYRGNFFSEDQGSFDGQLILFDPNVPFIPGEDSNGNGVMDESAFSLPVFPLLRNYHDRENPNEAVMLSPDPDGDGLTDDSQVHAGRTYTVSVYAHAVSSPFEPVILPGANTVLDSTPTGDDLIQGNRIDAGADGVCDSTALGDDVQQVPVGQSSPQPYALVIGGGIASTSAVRLDKVRYLCKDLATVTVLDVTAGLSAEQAAGALEIRVLAPGGGGIDSEAAPPLTLVGPGAGRFASGPIPMVDGVAAIPDDGILSIQDGATVVAAYDDADGPPRESLTGVDCKPDLQPAVVAMPGVDRTYSVQGGCDAPRRRDPRGYLLGMPGHPRGDLFLDPGELITYSVAFQNRELDADLIDAVATLRAVHPDGDDSTNPARLNNPPADGEGPGRRVTIRTPSRDIGLVPRGTLQSVSFDIEVLPSASFPETIEMVFGVSASRNGLPVETTFVFKHVLDVDLESFAYSTDFPAGGSEIRTYAGEFFNPVLPELDAEEFAFADATTTAFGGGNPQWAPAAPEPKAPWTFDLNNEGFTTSRRFDSNWGLNSELVLNLWHWAPTGECGFQSNDPSQTDPDLSNPNAIVRGQGGIWHTGTIGLNPPEVQRKVSSGRTGFDLGCEDYDIPADATTPTREQVLDVLSSPVFHRVHVDPDAGGFPYTLEFSRFAFNHQIDLADSNVSVAWEIDPDASTPNPVDPLDFGWLNYVDSSRGFLTGVSPIPYAAFNPNNPYMSGTPDGQGPQGPGSVGSFWALQDPSRAPARDLGEVAGRGFGTLQIRGAGGLPLRNVEEMLDGFYGGQTTLEDIYGANEIEDASPPLRRDDFRVHFAMYVRENQGVSTPNLPSYGIGIDDVVVEWIESHPVQDAIPCASLDLPHPEPMGSCARVLWDRAVISEPESSAVLTVLDPDAAYGPDGIAGTGDEQATDADANGLLEVKARVYSSVDYGGEEITLEQAGLLSPLYVHVVQLSASAGLNSDADGVIFMQQDGDGSSPVLITAQYADEDDGTGEACPDNPVRANMRTEFVGGNVVFSSARLTEIVGDGDGIPDDHERLRLDVTVVSNMLDSADNPVLLEETRLFLSSTDPDIACIGDNIAQYGDLVPGIAIENPPGDGFEFVVGEASRVSAAQLIRGEFSLGISASFVDVNGQRRQVSSFATPQRFAFDLDLDVVSGGTPAPAFLENWDAPGQGGDGVNTFTSGPLFPNNSIAAVDGSRCQYNDPDGPHPNGGGRSPSVCRPWSGSDWHVQTSSNAPAPKAFSGNGALLLGTHEPGMPASFDSYTTAQLSAAVSPTLHVGLGGGAVLSMRHIVAMADDRGLGVPAGHAADRAVVQAARVSPAGGTVLDGWETLPAFQNGMTHAGTDTFINCKFDPVDDTHVTTFPSGIVDPFLDWNSDDVSTEDDYFDPNDPERRLGPSTTCFPQFVFAAMGDWTSNDPAQSGNAFVPGARGALGNGIWVESRFSLDGFAGKSIRIRLLASGIEVGGPNDVRWANLFGDQLGNSTRGWIVDDFAVTGLVQSAVSLAPDLDPPPAPSCPADPEPLTPANEAACSLAVAEPGPDRLSPAPGFLVTLDGSASSLDSCVDGFIEYRWRLNGRVVQDWSHNPIFRDNPAFTSGYALDVRCSVDPECANTAFMIVSMGGDLREISAGIGPIALQVSHAPADPSAAVLEWEDRGPGLGYDVHRVDLQAIDPVALRHDPAAADAFLPAARLCRLGVSTESVVTFLDATPPPPAGFVLGYLVNSRRISDGVAGNLGAGLGADGKRRPRPAPPTAACP